MCDACREEQRTRRDALTQAAIRVWEAHYHDCPQCYCSAGRAQVFAHMSELMCAGERPDRARAQEQPVYAQLAWREHSAQAQATAAQHVAVLQSAAQDAATRATLQPTVPPTVPPARALDTAITIARTLAERVLTR